MANPGMRVLVFDSGVGGLSVLDALVESGAALELDYLADNAWLPYGLKSDQDLRARVPALLRRISEQWTPDAVVLACNTASTIALEEVRAVLPAPVIGVVPPIKPAAAASRSGVIGLLATPATVRRRYTDDLIAEFAADRTVIRFGATALVEAAERKLAGEIGGVDAAVAEAITGLFDAPGGAGIDVVALACTHFPLLARELAAAAPRPWVWLDSGAAIARRVVQVLSAAPGQAHVGRAAFTDIEAARKVYPAFRERGFGAPRAVSHAPGFVVGD